MPTQQTQQQQQPQPPMSEERLNKLLGPGGLSFLQALARDGGSEFKFGKDGKFSMTYDPREVMGQSQQALVDARQQAGPTSYAALDPADIIALMGQSQQTDQMAQQVPQLLSEMNYKGAAADQALGWRDRLAAEQQQAHTGAAISLLKVLSPDPGSPLEQAKLNTLAGLDPKAQQKALFPSAFTDPRTERERNVLAMRNSLLEQGYSENEIAKVEKRMWEGRSLGDQILGNLDFMSLATLPKEAQDIYKALVTDALKGNYSVEDSDGPGEDAPQVVRQPMPMPKSKSSKKVSEEELSKTRAAGEAAKIMETRNLPAKYWKQDATIPGLGTVKAIQGNLAFVPLGDGKILVLRKGD